MIYMTETKNLTYLIDLLDDPSDEIREVILKEIVSFGVTLEDQIHSREITLDDTRKKYLAEIFEKNDRIWLKNNWISAFGSGSELKKIEAGLSMISDFQNGRYYEKKLSQLLDALAEECLQVYQQPDHFQLIYFLFQQKRLKGAEQDYYNPLNSNLVYVLEKGLGIPISLVCILMLVGNRIGLTFSGCNFPGHFLGRFTNPRTNELVLVDCYTGGQIIYEEEFEAVKSEKFKQIEAIVQDETDAVTILRRVLSNLINAYRKNGDTVNSEFFEALMERT